MYPIRPSLFCDSDGAALKIDFKISAALNISFMPPSVTSFQYTNAAPFRQTALRSVDLPQSLKFLHIVHLQFPNHFDFTALPARMKRLYLVMNEMFGSCDLRSLPTEIEDLIIALVGLSGSLYLDKLPPTLHTIRAQGNNLRAP